MPFLYRLFPKHILSTKRLRQALQLIVTKHQPLRTSLVFNEKKNSLIQSVIDFNDDNNIKLFTFTESIFETDEQLSHIMHDERHNSQFFDLSQGLVFQCRLVYYKQISSNHHLSDKDALIFNFHHASFDFPSMDIFLYDLNRAYTTSQLSNNDNTALRYLDCTYKYIVSSFPIK